MHRNINISGHQNCALYNAEILNFRHYQNADYQRLFFMQKPFTFTGKENDEETGYGYFGARYMDHELMTMWLSVDPMADKYPSISPYAYCAWNPVRLVDPDGEEVSTHTDKNGKVVAVYNDGDLGVYRHSGDEQQTMKELADNYNSTSNTSAGGQRMGCTAYWDEFMTHNNKTGEPIEPKGVIFFGESWDKTIARYNSLSRLIGLEITASCSLNEKLFDIKTNSTVAPEGYYTGKLLNGKYSTAESAGNYLAGMNGASGITLFGLPISRDDYMKMAGMLHSTKNSTDRVPPYWGEIPYAGRRIDEGFKAGRIKLAGTILLRKITHTVLP